MEEEMEMINLSGDKEVPTDKLPGVLFKGRQYYDFKTFNYINSMGVANLIRLLKYSLRNGIEVHFINVNDRIKNKIKALGLDHILHCDEK